MLSKAKLCAPLFSPLARAGLGRRDLGRPVLVEVVAFFCVVVVVVVVVGVSVDISVDAVKECERDSSAQNQQQRHAWQTKNADSHPSDTAAAQRAAQSSPRSLYRQTNVSSVQPVLAAQPTTVLSAHTSCVNSLAAGCHPGLDQL
jgi:hypothetical protein